MQGDGYLLENVNISSEEVGGVLGVKGIIGFIIIMLLLLVPDQA